MIALFTVCLLHTFIANSPGIDMITLLISIIVQVLADRPCARRIRDDRVGGRNRSEIIGIDGEGSGCRVRVDVKLRAGTNRAVGVNARHVTQIDAEA